LQQKLLSRNLTSDSSGKVTFLPSIDIAVCLHFLFLSWSIAGAKYLLFSTTGMGVAGICGTWATGVAGLCDRCATDSRGAGI
jgi:hypothetical protein